MSLSVDQHVEAGTKIFVRALLIVLALWFLYAIRDILAVVFLALVTVAALNPAIVRLQRLGLHRAVAVVLTYLSLIALFVLLFSFLIPPLVAQTSDFFENFNRSAERFLQWEQSLRLPGNSSTEQTIVNNLHESLMGSFDGLFSTTLGIFSGIVSFIVFFFLALYMSLEERGIEKFLTSIIPERFHEYTLSLVKRVQRKIGQWLFGQLLSMFLIFIVYWIGLSLLGVPYALTLALFGGLLEIVPYVGPIIASIPALLLAFFTSPILGLAVAVFYTVAHQIESHVITPQIMRRAVGINPVAVILALLIGAKLGGVLGLILAVPAATVISVFVKDYLKKRTA